MDHIRKLTQSCYHPSLEYTRLWFFLTDKWTSFVHERSHQSIEMSSGEDAASLDEVGPRCNWTTCGQVLVDELKRLGRALFSKAPVPFCAACSEEVKKDRWRWPRTPVGWARAGAAR